MQKYRLEIRWSVFFTIASLLWIYIERFVGLHTTNIDKQEKYSLLFIVPAVCIYALALLDKKKKEYRGQMLYLQSLLCGFILTIFITALSPLSQYITHTIISPDYFTNVKNYALLSGKAKIEDIETYFTLRNYIVKDAIFSLIFGTTTTAILSIFITSKNKK